MLYAMNATPTNPSYQRDQAQQPQNTGYRVTKQLGGISVAGSSYGADQLHKVFSSLVASVS
jgi:hypothetical protein